MGHNIFITDEERNELVTLHGSMRDRRKADRIKAVLMLDEGYTYVEVSHVLLLGTETIRKSERLYKKGGIESLVATYYVGYSGKLTNKQQEKLAAHLRTHTYPTSLEIREYVKSAYNVEYSHDGIIKLLHRLGFSYKKMKGVPSKADKEEQQKFVEKYKKMRENLKKDEKIYFLDASHPVYNSVPSYAWIEKGTEKELLQVSGRQHINLNGLYSPIDGETMIRRQDRINGKSTLELFKSIRSKHPELSRIIIVHDNARAYHAKLLKENLPEGIEMVALPPYSPNLNLIERLWKLFRKHVMNNRYHESYSDFTYATSSFFRTLHFRTEELQSLMSENFHVIQC